MINKVDALFYKLRNYCSKCFYQSCKKIKKERHNHFKVE